MIVHIKGFHVSFEVDLIVEVRVENLLTVKSFSAVLLLCDLDVILGSGSSSFAGIDLA